MMVYLVKGNLADSVLDQISSNKSFEVAREKRGRDAQKSRAPQFNRYMHLTYKRIC